MSAFNFLMILFQTFTPIAIGEIVSSVSVKSIHGFSRGLVAFGICMFIQKMFQRQMELAREWILYIHWGNMDRRMTELFFEKSLGQHIQEASLSVSGIDKGRWNLLGLQGFLFFDGLPVLYQLTVSLVCIIVLTLGGGGLMFLAFCIYLLYSFYLNFNVMRVCSPIDRSLRRLNKRRAERMEKPTRVMVSSQSKREVSEMTEWFNRDAGNDRDFWLWFIKKSTWRGMINVVLLLLVITYGGYLVWIDEWKIGFLVPLIMWSTRIVENIWQLGVIEQKINWSLPSVRHMINALSIPPDVIDIPNPIQLCRSTPQRIVLEGISHSYPTEKPIETDEDGDDDPDDTVPADIEVPPTLRKVSFTIEPGEKVALLGPSGAGKTTIMRLILRFMDPQTGSISIGGHDLRDIALDSWMGGVGYIAQQAEVFDGTIRENLTYRLSATDCERITDDELWDLMRRLKIDFGKRLDKGLDTRVGKHGLKLSGGQAQRLMIGAAVIGNPWFMLIDEATSSLDSSTEKEVLHGLTQCLTENTSALVIAHRLSTVRNRCTKFVVLKAASEVANGDSQVEAVASSFEELYRISPVFRQLADDQSISIN